MDSRILVPPQYTMPTKHPPAIDLSVSDAAAYLAKRRPKLEPFLQSLEADARIGMRELARKTRNRRKAERTERSRVQKMLKHERRLWQKGIVHVAGVDEVGRGPLAGPVVAAAVILPQGISIERIDDSKALKPEEREELFDLIMKVALATSVGNVSAEEIDRINIYQATLKAMRTAIRGLDVQPDRVLVDGNRVPESGFNELAIIGGDAASQSIAAASVIAKVIRDREMREWDRTYPGYGFASHKGYASEAHTKSLNNKGPCPIHRRSFCTVEDALASWSEPFQEVRSTIDRIVRLAELGAYKQQIQRRSSKLSQRELQEIGRRIERRTNQLRKPGIAGEEAAENWLVQSGYLILERNLRVGRGEIDLVAQQGDTLAFIEVKTTSGTESGIEERVTHQKQARITSAAAAYLYRCSTSLAPRFDVITVHFKDDVPVIRHFPSAFESGPDRTR